MKKKQGLTKGGVYVALKMLTENTAAEAAEVLGLPGEPTEVKGMIRRKLVSGAWPGRKEGKFWWFDPEEIRAHIQNQA